MLLNDSLTPGEGGGSQMKPETRQLIGQNSNFLDLTHEIIWKFSHVNYNCQWKQENVGNLVQVKLSTLSEHLTEWQHM